MTKKSFFISFIIITSEFEQELSALQRDCAAGNAFERLLEKGHRRPPQNSPRTFDIKFQSLDLEGEKKSATKMSSLSHQRFGRARRLKRRLNDYILDVSFRGLPRFSTVAKTE